MKKQFKSYRTSSPAAPAQPYRRASPDVPQHFGLGDAVAAVAQPIARVIDKVAGTHIERCGACAKRRAALNRLLPNLKNPLK